MNHTARQKLGYLLAAIYDDHLPSGSHCLSMEDKKAAIEDMETTLSKVRNIVGSINFGGLLYLKKVTKPRVQLQLGDGQIFGDESSLKKDGGESGDGTAADQLKILLDKPSIVYMSQSTGAPNAALIVGEKGEIDFDLFYRSVLKDTTPGTVMFLVSGEEFPADKVMYSIFCRFFVDFFRFFFRFFFSIFIDFFRFSYSFRNFIIFLNFDH